MTFHIGRQVSLSIADLFEFAISRGHISCRIGSERNPVFAMLASRDAGVFIDTRASSRGV
ncbi:MAG: hypothetical protein H6851_06315 [Geminicoccaceae bacterium]|nr:hypothetical protein [Geminicoccaceae bacterium]